MRDLTSPDEIDDLLREPEAVLLKHGARCPISAEMPRMTSSTRRAPESLTTNRRRWKRIWSSLWGLQLFSCLP